MTCSTCGKPLHRGGIHTCFDPALAVAIKDAEQRVAEAANAFVPRDIGTWEMMALAGFIPETQLDLARAVANYRALAPQREGQSNA